MDISLIAACSHANDHPKEKQRCRIIFFRREFTVKKGKVGVIESEETGSSISTKDSLTSFSITVGYSQVK